MAAFKGFPAGDVRFTPLPDQFFSELLPAIHDLAELKVTLHVLWLLHGQRGYPRYVSGNQLQSDPTLLKGLHDMGETAVCALERGLEQAVARGTLLQLTTWQGHGAEATSDRWYFLNDPEGRRACREVREGKLQLHVHVVPPAVLPAERPTIYDLYEQHIGLLSPIMAEELSEAAEIYPDSWIKEAFQIAVERRVRRWRYVRGILDRWMREGKDGRRT
ncbi:MAG: DnaD domain protein [Anaerolineae bacterium]|nr:MAG: DnaD domain protein [Anaerolineae bacterium]